MPRTKEVREEFDRHADDYEFKRWFSQRGQWEHYRALYETLAFHLEGVRFTRCLEVGPGPGTWTRMLLQRAPEARFTLVDLSGEMLAEARRALGERRNISYVQADYLDARLRPGYDFFFSSRAVEYMTDKRRFAERTFTLLKPGGRGLVVTKNPLLLTRRIEPFVGRRPSEVHCGRIAPQALMEHFRDVGFSEVRAYPCTLNFPPGRKSFWLSRVLWKRFHKRELSSQWIWAVESYILEFVR